MFSWDAVAKACNALEWNFSFSIGDGITLVVALATTMIAFLTYRIQKEQKAIVEQQNKIIERQVTIDEIKFERENKLLRDKLLERIYLITNAIVGGRDVKEEWVDYINDNQFLVEHFFSKKLNLFTEDLLICYENASHDNLGSFRDEDVAKVKKDLLGVVAELFGIKED